MAKYINLDIKSKKNKAEIKILPRLFYSFSKNIKLTIFLKNMLQYKSL